MSDGAANEARISVSTDFESFKEFIEYSKRGLDEMKQKGKSAFGELSKDVGDFARFAVGGAIVSAGRELVTAVTAPLHKGLQEIIADAEKFRSTITRVAVSAGQDVGTITKEMNKLSRETLRSVEDVNSFIQNVKGQTGDRAAAVKAVAGASKEARARGLDSVSEMAPLVGTLQRRWKVGDTEKFFNRQRAGAKALGLDPNQAAALFEKQAEGLARTGMSAEESAQFSASMLKTAGGDQQVAMEAGQTLQGFVEGRLPWIERHLRGAGMLGKDATLRDKYNRVDLAKALRLMHQHQKAKRGQKGLDWASLLNLGSTPGAAIFSRGMEEFGQAMDAQTAVAPGQDLRAAESAFRGTDEGKSQAEQRRIEQENRDMADPLMKAKLEAQKNAGGWRGWLGSKVVGALGTGAGGVLTGKALAAMGLAKGGAGGLLAAGGTWAGGALAAGAAGYGVGTLLDRATGASDWLSKQAFELMYNPQTGQRREAPAGAGGMPLSAMPMSAPSWAPPTAAHAAPAPDARQQAEIQAKHSAEELRRGTAIPVRLVGPMVMQTGPAPTVGQGGQR